MHVIFIEEKLLWASDTGSVGLVKTWMDLWALEGGKASFSLTWSYVAPHKKVRWFSLMTCAILV